MSIDDASFWLMPAYDSIEDEETTESQTPPGSGSVPPTSFVRGMELVSSTRTFRFYRRPKRVPIASGNQLRAEYDGILYKKKGKVEWTPIVRGMRVVVTGQNALCVGIISLNALHPSVVVLVGDEVRDVPIADVQPLVNVKVTSEVIFGLLSSQK